MNGATIVKVEATPAGLHLRLWIDDSKGEHLCVAETFVQARTLAMWWVQVREEEDRAAQSPLPFDV